MALVIMGGLVVSTFLTAVLLPATATLAEDGVHLGGRLAGWLVKWPRRRLVRPVVVPPTD